MTIVREHGKPYVTAAIAKELARISEICGGGMSGDAFVFMAGLIIDRWENRSINAIRIMLRDGLNNGKIYGKLTYPVISEWMNEHEERVDNWNYQRHLSTK